jgi:hypothetical protein
MHIEYESSGIIHVGEDATLSYSYRPKPKGHNLAVIFHSFLLFKICLVIPDQELLVSFQHAIAQKGGSPSED